MAHGNLDRLLPDARRIKRRGDSRRKNRGKANAWSAYAARELASGQHGSGWPLFGSYQASQKMTASFSFDTSWRLAA